MKIQNFLLKLSLTATFVVATGNFVKAQTGNQSDITGPSPTDIIRFNNQSDVTGPDPTGTAPFTPITSDQVGTVKVDQKQYQSRLIQSTPSIAIQLIEAYNGLEFQEYLELKLYGEVPTAEEISNRLAVLSQETGKKTAVIYASKVEEQINLLTVLPNENLTANNPEKLIATTEDKNLIAQNNLPIIKKIVPISSAEFQQEIETIQDNLSDPFFAPRDTYIGAAQELYNSIIRPLAEDLENNDIDILVFVLDENLRGLPIAALYNQETQQYLIEEYAVAIIPSFGLTDTRYEYVDLNLLAMGASQFKEQSDLPSVPIELQEIVSSPREGVVFLNEQFTIDNFTKQNQEAQFDVIHLGTHALFNAGDISKSYIQFFDNKLSLKQLEALSVQLGWNVPEDVSVELLVLSACQTALGNREAELGFAGLAVASGVKSVLASSWFVSDLGTLALMTQFYENYTNIPFKSEAFRQAQLSLLRGEVFIENEQIVLADGSTIPLPEEFQGQNIDLSHPYIWSAFKVIGNWN